MEGTERSFADLAYKSKKRARREKFLEKMKEVIPWGKLLEQIRPYYPSGEKGREPYPLKGLLRVIVSNSATTSVIREWKT